MRVVGWDTETVTFQPGLQAPPIVCMTWATAVEAEGGAWDKLDARIVHWTDPLCYRLLKDWLEDDETLMVGHNVGYDFRVVAAAWPDLLPLIFAKYRKNLVTDTQTRQELIDIAAGEYRKCWDKKLGKFVARNYQLLDVTKRHTDRILQKDGWRVSYANFLDVPLDQWLEHAPKVQEQAVPKVALLKHKLTFDPKNKKLKDEIQALEDMISSPPEQCIDYPLADAQSTLDIYLSQREDESYLEDQFRQCQREWALGLASCHGLRTDEEGVRLLEQEVRNVYESTKNYLIEVGLIHGPGKKGKKAGSRDTKAAKARMVQVCRELKISLPRTKTYKKEIHGEDDETIICLDRDACARVDDEQLNEYAMFSTLSKMMTNDIQALLQGIWMPIHTRFGRAETGRTTSSKPNVQNWRREELELEEEEDEAA